MSIFSGASKTVTAWEKRTHNEVQSRALTKIICPRLQNPLAEEPNTQ